MNRKAFVAAAAITTLLFALFGVQFIEGTNSYPIINRPAPTPVAHLVDIPEAEAPAVTITPPNGSLCITSNVVFEYELTEPTAMPEGFSLRSVDVSYLPDWQRKSTLAANYVNYSRGPAAFTVPNVPDGNHSILVKVVAWFRTNITASGTFDIYKRTVSQLIYFSVDTVPPSIANLRVESDGNESTVQVTFNTVENVPWMGYSFDSSEYETVTGNFTLSYISHGTHTLVVSANDTYGNVEKSDTVLLAFFEIPSPTPFPAQTRDHQDVDWILPATVAAIILVCLTASALVFVRRRRRR
jgi:hypothetical protein